MPLQKNYKEYINTLFRILLSSIFLLSTLGKFLDISSFQKVILTYGFPSYIAYVVLIIESILSIGFCFSICLKQIAKFSIIFIILLTIITSVGYYLLDISTCDCFGRIYFLNPSNHSLFLLKNILLIMMSFYIFRNSIFIENYKWLKKFIILLSTIVLTFISFKYNDYYIENYSKRNIGSSIKDLNINTGKIINIEYLFLFSPSCDHCTEVIPKINTLKRKYRFNIVGVTAESNVAKLKNVPQRIDFPVLIVKDRNFMKITKVVPVIFKCTNDTIKNIHDVENFITHTFPNKN
jgi:uncharacterized membrane protein YphA (DoxX/SURF4 family)/thiol-disulfide isomerase/thioredoxin